MALPNGNQEKIKVYPNEYINNITINRSNLMLLENDIYLLELIEAGGLALAAYVNVPSSSTDSGSLGEKAIDESFIYFYTGTKWARSPIDVF